MTLDTGELGGKVTGTTKFMVELARFADPPYKEGE